MSAARLRHIRAATLDSAMRAERYRRAYESAAFADTPTPRATRSSAAPRHAADAAAPRCRCRVARHTARADTMPTRKRCREGKYCGVATVRSLIAATPRTGAMRARRAAMSASDAAATQDAHENLAAPYACAMMPARSSR